MDVTWKNFLNSLYNKGYVKGALQTFTYNGFNEQELLYYNMSSGAIVHATSYRKLIKCAFSYCELQKGIDQLNYKIELGTYVFQDKMIDLILLATLILFNVDLACSSRSLVLYKRTKSSGNSSQ